MSQQIQFRRGTAAQWTLANPILASGEFGLETDTQLYKVGNGTDTWADLYYGGIMPELLIAVFETQTASESVATAGTMKLYARDFAGHALPEFRGPSGTSSPVQASLFANGVQMYNPGATTAPLAFGGPALTSVGTVSHPTLAATNLRTQTSRWNVLSAATANSAAENRVSTLRIWRGDAAGLGGFFHRCRFAIVSAVANQRSFFGFNTSTSAIPTTQEPNALTNMIGVGNGLGQTTLRIYGNDASGSATEVDLGVSFPANDSTAVYDFTLHAEPNASTVSWEIENLTTGAVQTGTIADADLPVSTTFLCWHAYMNNGGTAAAVNFDVMRVYTETDY